MASIRGIDAIHKAKELMDLLAELGNAVTDLEVCDHWEADLCAVGIAASTWPARLGYVSCHGADAGHAHYVLEEDAREIQSADNVRVADVIMAMKWHLCPPAIRERDCS